MHWHPTGYQALPNPDCLLGIQSCWKTQVFLKLFERLRVLLKINQVIYQHLVFLSFHEDCWIRTSGDLFSIYN